MPVEIVANALRIDDLRPADAPALFGYRSWVNGRTRAVLVHHHESAGTQS
jgi:hypothetical protein